MIGIAETHSTGNKGIQVDGYNWFGFNRKNIHVRAKTGSGRDGLLIRNNSCSQFNVEIIDNGTDGILWVIFEDKNCLQNFFCVCVIYLPPENSTRAGNVNEFFETLMTKIYTLPQGSPFYLCGDWNSRCSDSNAGIDSVPERHVIDFHHNGYGSTSCDFLIDVNGCILNGHKTVKNDFTFVSSRGSSVVDYFVVPYEMLECFDNFKVTRTSEIINETCAIGKYDLTRIVPDHSFLSLDFTLNFCSGIITNKLNISQNVRETTKYDTRNLSDDWLLTSSAISEINVLIHHLQSSEANQDNIKRVYEDFVSAIKNEMSSKLQSKTIRIHDGASNKYIY
ncbi:Hypothetical predicted protein [Mytilus galloprovincialis]|uniref:Endonuclease/exonuclease/phosphatase domain-containing protein n=1 Tax=Mytilus galloprovincialis TaxID=29158 RepID=A0A8B6BJL0_MYTGA|nr:Hypothetical predicted protein [Mytilus galloprovincialis]